MWRSYAFRSRALHASSHIRFVLEWVRRNERHSFDCRNCGETITVRMDVDYETLATPVTPEKNAVISDELPGSPIVNLDAMCLIPPDADGADMAFFRIDELRKRIEKALERGPLLELPTDAKMTQYRPFRRPDHKAEWGHIRRVMVVAESRQRPVGHEDTRRSDECTLRCRRYKNAVSVALALPPAGNRL